MEEAQAARKRRLTLGDIDPMIDRYRVYVKDGTIERTIGTKRADGWYEKPEWQGTNRIPYKERTYKKNPPWLTREVVRIRTGWGIEIEVKEKKR